MKFWRHKMVSDVLDIAKSLIRIESTNPGCFESRVADYIEGLFEDLPGYASFKRIDVESGRPIVMLEIKGREEGKELAFICHMDTVPIAGGWTYDPLGAKEDNGRLYGRGSCDMKGGTAGALSAILSLLKSKVQPLYTVKFIGTMDEEGDMKGVEKVLELGWVDKDTLILDTEPTDAEVQTAHKSRFWFHYVMEGKAAHASKPHEGADAIIALSYAISYIKEKIAALQSDSFLGSSTMAVGMIKGGIHPYQVPGEASCYIDMRIIAKYTIDDILKILEDAGEFAATKVPGVKAHIEITGKRDAVMHYPDSELLALMKQSIEAAGFVYKVNSFPGYTDTAVIASTIGNKNSMSYGPGRLNEAHKPDEYVAIEDLIRCEKVYKKLIENYLTM